MGILEEEEDNTGFQIIVGYKIKGASKTV